MSTISPVSHSRYTWFVPRVRKAMRGAASQRTTVWSTDAGLYITPKGLTVAGNRSSTNRRPMLSAKHEPTKSSGSSGSICTAIAAISTLVVKTMG